MPRPRMRACKGTEGSLAASLLPEVIEATKGVLNAVETPSD